MLTLPAYKSLAKYYDLLNSEKDYQSEAKAINALIEKYKRSTNNSLLEVACGTGKHLQYLKDKFSVLGTDLNKEMLAAACQNFPDIPFKQADMINLNLKTKFDA